MAEIEIGVLSGQCLARRIPSQDDLTVQVDAWNRARNDSGALIKWMFDLSKAREKLGRAYPTPLHPASQAAA